MPRTMRQNQQLIDRINGLQELRRRYLNQGKARQVNEALAATTLME